jgi:hypothetical protein
MLFTLPTLDIGARMKKRSSVWLALLLIAAVDLGATTFWILEELERHTFDLGRSLVAGGAALLVFVAAMWVTSIEFGRRRAYARLVRQRRERAEQQRAAELRQARELSDARIRAAIEHARMEEPTYPLPPAIVYTRTPLPPPPARNPLRETLVRELLTPTGEIRIIRR